MPLTAPALWGQPRTSLGHTLPDPGLGGLGCAVLRPRLAHAGMAAMLLTPLLGSAAAESRALVPAVVLADLPPMACSWTRGEPRPERRWMELYRR